MPAHVSNHSAELRAGAFLALAGGVLNVVSNAVQPPISDYANTMEVFAALAATPLWEISRIGVLIASLLGSYGLFLVRWAFQGRRGESWFLLAVGSAFGTTPVIAIMMGLDLAQKQMAKLIAASPPEQAALAVWAGHGLHSAAFAIFSISLVLASVMPVLVGMALILGRQYPTWLGWFSVVGGIGVLVTAVLQAVNGPTPIAQVLFPAFGLLVTVPLMTWSVLIWRRAASQ